MQDSTNSTPGSKAGLVARTLPVVLLAAGGLVATSVAPAHAVRGPYPSQVCQNKVEHGYAVETIGSRLEDLNLKHISISVAVGYKSCHYPGQLAYARVNWWRVTTNVEGTSTNCAGSAGGGIGSPHGYYRTEFNGYFSDFGGHNFAASQKVYCSSGTYSTVYKELKSDRLYFMAGETPPKARVNYVVRMNSSHDPAGTLKLTFKKY